MKKLFTLIIALFCWQLSISQSVRYYDRLPAVPLSVLNLDPQSGAWGGIQVVAPLNGAFVQKEGNPALFHKASFQQAIHASNWFISDFNGEDTFQIAQIQGSARIFQKHQIGWGMKYFMPDSAAYMIAEEFALNQARLKAQQFSLNYAYKLNSNWHIGTALHAHSWLFAARNASFSRDLVPGSIPAGMPIDVNSWGLSLDVGALYANEILLHKNRLLGLQAGFSLLHLGPPLKWKSSLGTISDFLPTNLKAGGMISMLTKIENSPLHLRACLGYEWEKRLIRGDNYPSNSSYGRILLENLVYHSYPGSLHKIGLELSLKFPKYGELSLRGGLQLPHEVLTIGGSLAVKHFFIGMAYQDSNWGSSSYTYFINDWRFSLGYRKSI